MTRRTTAVFLVLACVPCCIPLLGAIGGSLLAVAGAFAAFGVGWLPLVLAVTAIGLAVSMWRIRRRSHAEAQQLPFLDSRERAANR